MRKLVSIFHFPVLLYFSSKMGKHLRVCVFIEQGKRMQKHKKLAKWTLDQTHTHTHTQTDTEDLWLQEFTLQCLFKSTAVCQKWWQRSHDTVIHTAYTCLYPHREKKERVITFYITIWLYQIILTYLQQEKLCWGSEATNQMKLISGSRAS